MKRYSLHDLPLGKRHILSGLLPGEYLVSGGLGFKGSGHRSHDVGCQCGSCDGKGRHVHQNDSEVFIILQGKARMEVDGKFHDLVAGDVVICEPGEDHHLVSDMKDPCVNIYLHAGNQPHPKQQVKEQ